MRGHATSDRRASTDAGNARSNWKNRLATGRRGFISLAGGVAASLAAIPGFSQVASAVPLVEGGALRYVGEIIGTSGYDYAPSVMWGDGVTMKMWWCGTGGGDVIYYSELDGGSWSTPEVVMTPANSGWDDYHVCDPSVVKGNFYVDGSNWDYAMYYGGANDSVGTDTHIGVAFSNDGKNWQKYSNNPIVHPDAHNGGYGAGMPSAYREAGTDNTVWLAFFDSSSDPNNHYVKASDAISFGARTDLTANPVSAAAIGDIAYFPDEQVWYVCTKNNNDEEIYLYKTANSDLNSTWTQAARINSALTGNAKNHNPGWLRQPNGHLYQANGTRYNRVYFGTGDDSSSTWDIGEALYMDGWEFDVDGNREAWTTANVSADGGEPTDGSWKCIADQNDPQWNSPDLAIHAGGSKTISIRLSNHNDDTNGKIYFKTTSEDYLSEDKSVSFDVDNTGDWMTYDVNMGTNGKWSGMVTGLRVDPIASGSGDSLGISYIRVDG